MIKRYPNRKLYNTEAKQYVSLEAIAELVRGGAEVQVIDHATGEDLTTLILTQIIVGQEKTRSGFLPASVLTGLVRTGGNTLTTLRHGLAAPLDLLHGIDDEIERRVHQLIDLGELAEDEGWRLIRKLTDPSALVTPPAANDGMVRRLRDLPTRQDVRALSDALDQLTVEVEALTARQRAAGQ